MSISIPNSEMIYLLRFLIKNRDEIASRQAAALVFGRPNDEAIEAALLDSALSSGLLSTGLLIVPKIYRAGPTKLFVGEFAVEGVGTSAADASLNHYLGISLPGVQELQHEFDTAWLNSAARAKSLAIRENLVRQPDLEVGIFVRYENQSWKVQTRRPMKQLRRT